MPAENMRAAWFESFGPAKKVIVVPQRIVNVVV